MKKNIIISVCIFLSVSIFAQKTDAMLFGDVKDKNSGEHIPYAELVIKGTALGTTSDATGHFKLSNLPLGEQIIEVTAWGYKSTEVKVIMEKDKSTELYVLLEEDLFNLEQVVVTGTRSSHYVKDVPIRTEVLTAQSLINKKAWNVFEALEGVSGITVESQCQFCNFSMVRMHGLGAEHTQVLINGQPVYSGLASIYGLEQIGTGDVDRIEIVKGAGAALYNSSAVAGAINIITKEPTFSPSLNLDLQFGNHNSKILNFNSSIRSENGKVGLTLYGQKINHGVIDETSEGTTRKEVWKPDGISDRVESDLNNFGFGVYFFSPFFKKDKLIIRGKSISEERRGGEINNDLYKNPFSSGTENIKTKRYEAELNYNVPLSKRSEINYSMVYVNHNREATNDTFLGDYMETHNDSTPNVEDMRPYIANENTITPTLTFSSKLGNNHLMAGVQVYFSQLKESGLYMVTDSASSYYSTAYKSISKKHSTEYGIFVQDEWQIIPSLTIVPGVRLDHHQSGEEYSSDIKVFDKNFPKTEFKKTSIHPRFAIKYSPAKRITLRANFGTGFRAPYGFSEDLHLCSGSPRVWKSSSLKGESSYSYNLSADYYGHHLQVNANLFRTDLKDKIGFTEASDEIKNMGYTYMWQNIDDAYVQGAEMTIMVNPVRDLNIGLDFSINDGQYKNAREDWKGTEYEEISKKISRLAFTSGSLKAEYSPKSWFFSVNAIYQGTKYIDYFSENDADSKIKKTNPYITLNALISKQFGFIKLYIGGKNLIGYVQDEKHLDDAAFIYAPLYGRTIYGGASIRL